MSTGVVIRLRNLPVTAGTIDIRRFFERLSIPDGGVHIIGGDDGTAFILFATDEDARQAMLRDGQKITNNKIKLMLSSHTEMRNMIEESQRRYEELRGLRPPEPPITNLTNRSSAAGQEQDAYNNQERTAPPEFYIELRGMPYNVSEVDIVEFFSALPLAGIRIIRDKDGQPTGQGFVKFKTSMVKIQALKKDHDFMGPRFVRVVSASERQWAMANGQLPEPARQGLDPYGGRKRGQGGTPSNEGTPKRSRALSPIRCDNCVEMRGLPPTATYKMVADFFYRLKFVEGGLFVEMDGKSCKGRAFAEFMNATDYKEALLKDGEMLDGKQVRVISIPRQAMFEHIKQHKKYMKVRREDEYKKEREEMERKDKEKFRERQMKEAQDKQRKLYEEQQRKDEEERKKRREIQMKKQREMEEWLARQHMKEEEERKRLEFEKRILAQEKMQEQERRKEAERRMEEQRRRDAERHAEEHRRRAEEMRKKEEEQIRFELERKREMEMRRMDEMRAHERPIKEKKYRNYETQVIKDNGLINEVEMDLGDGANSPNRQEKYKNGYENHYQNQRPVSPRRHDHMTPRKTPERHFPPQFNQSGRTTPNLLHHGSSGNPVNNPPVFSPSSVPMVFPPPPLPNLSGNPPSSLPPFSSGNIPAPMMAPPPSSGMPPISLPSPTMMVGNLRPHPPPTLPPPPIPPALGVRTIVGIPAGVEHRKLGVMPEVPPHAMFPPPPVQVVSLPNIVTTSSLTAVSIGPPGPNLNPPLVPTSVGNENDSKERKPLRTVFVRIANSPFDTTESDVRNFFEGFAIAQNGIEFVYKNNRRSGHIFIKFISEDEAAKAVGRGKNRLGNREILVKLATLKQLQDIYGKFDKRNFDDLFCGKYRDHQESKKLDPNVERRILSEKLTCIRVSNVPKVVTPEQIFQAFKGIISIMPNGIHIIHDASGNCTGETFVEVLTPEDCIRAALLNGVGKVNGVEIRVVATTIHEMNRALEEQRIKYFSRPPPGLPPVSMMQGQPLHPAGIRIRVPIGIPSMPVIVKSPGDVVGLRFSAPLRLPEHELAMLRPIEMRHPPMPPPRPLEFRDLPRPPLPGPIPEMVGWGRSVSPPHMNRSNSPAKRPQSPRSQMHGKRNVSPGRPMPPHRTPSPPMRSRSPMNPREAMHRHELEQQAELGEMHRRMDRERDMRERDAFYRGVRVPGPHPMNEPPRFPMDRNPRFHMDMPRFRMEGPRFPVEGPFRDPHFPGNAPMPRFRLPSREPKSVKMTNLSFHITQDDIIDFFIKFNPIPQSVRLMYNNQGKLTGDGMIDFPNREAADAAVSTLNNKSLLNRKVFLYHV